MSAPADAGAASLRRHLVVALTVVALVALAAVVALVVLARNHQQQTAALALDASTGLDRTSGGLVAVAGVLVGVLVAAAVVVLVATRRWVIGPLHSLALGTRASADDPSTPVPEHAGGAPAEVAALAGEVERLRAELVRRLAEADLARSELEAVHAELAAQADELRRSNADLEQFAYVASHDLREPLRKVASFTQLLSQRYAGQLDDHADQYIGYAVDGARRMQRMVEDLLAFSQVGRTGVVGPVDLADTLAQVVDDLQVSIEQVGGVVVGTDLPVVTGEAGLLGQLVANLVRNALAYRAEEPPVVRFAATATGDGWELSCRDNGVGIAPQDAERVFVLFERLSSPRGPGGTGIGLALCRRIVEHHGGRIWVDTSAKDGATIRWTLPA